MLTLPLLTRLRRPLQWLQLQKCRPGVPTLIVAGKIAEVSFQQWVGTNDDALCCCCMNMLSAGRAKIAECGSGQLLLAHGERAFARQERATLGECDFPIWGSAIFRNPEAGGESLPHPDTGIRSASVAGFDSTSR